MRCRVLWILCLAAAAGTADLRVGCSANPQSSAADAQAPWKPFVAATVPGNDGQPIALILTPDRATGSWVIILGGTTPWRLTPMSDTPTPPSPVPPAPPSPAPIPPTPPTPAEAAKNIVIEAARKLPHDPQFREDAQKLSAVYKLLANQIPAPIDTIEKLITANRYAREIALGPVRAAAWTPWIEQLGKWLDGQRAACMIKTIADCKTVWIAIGEALADIAATK